MINLSATSPAQRWLVPLFFVITLGIGLLIYRDYGVSVDENQSRDNGMLTLRYIAEPLAPKWIASDHDFDKYTTPLAEYYDRDYGIAFETPVCLVERLIGYDDAGDKFMFRHLCTFLVCFWGIVAVYQLAARRFADWRLGLLAALWFLLSPRLFAELFYNDKDAVFMALFAVATNTGVRLLLRPAVGRALVHALACAITIDVRIMGVLLPLVTVAFLVWRGIQAEVKWARVASTAAIYMGAVVGLVILFWPYLWPAPMHNFIEAFRKMSSFRWGGDVLYMGNFVMADNLPWHYSLVWLSITTPLLYVVGGLIGLGGTVREMVRQRWRLWQHESQMQDVLFLSLFVGPILAVIVLHSVLYDGWRQVYFVYPAFLLLALRGWVAALRWRPTKRWWPTLLYGATALSLLITTVGMVRDHPLQNVYFNLLAGSNTEKNFEMDYWGVGYRLDLAYIADHEMRPVVKVASPPHSQAGFNNIMLPPYQRERLVFVTEPDSADYFVTNYRWHPAPYPYGNEVFQVRVSGRRVHSVFQLK